MAAFQPGATLLYGRDASETLNKNFSYLRVNLIWEVGKPRTKQSFTATVKPVFCSKGLHDHQDDDADEQDRRELVEHPVPALRVRIAVRRKLLQQRKASAVIPDEHQHQREFHVQPAHE